MEIYAPTLSLFKNDEHTLFAFATAGSASTLYVCKHHIDGLAQDCSNSSEIAMELLQSCTKPSI